MSQFELNPSSSEPLPVDVEALRRFGRWWDCRSERSATSSESTDPAEDRDVA
jgi:hypothetical protein